MTKTIAIVLAAGEGTRLQKTPSKIGNLPKAYVKLHGCALLTHSLNFFLSCEYIDTILPVIGKGHDVYYNDLAFNNDKTDKLLPYVYGGKTRQESVFNALTSLKTQFVDIVCIHDCARPIFNIDFLKNMLKTLTHYDGVTPYKPIYDSVIRMKKQDTANSPHYIDRTDLYTVQTPQCFRYDSIIKAHQEQRDNNKTFGDDISLALDKGAKICFYDATSVNTTKITDLNTLKRLENDMSYSSMHTCSGIGYDTHRIEMCESSEANDKTTIKLGNVSIACNYKIIAHSDGDVLIHALCDALYGALGEGDIGKFFPPTDPQWHNVDSMVFLEHAVERVAQRNAHIINIDCTIIAEQPKILPYHNAITERLATLIKIHPSQLNIKATTNEKIGFLGRQEGIAAIVIANISRPV